MHPTPTCPVKGAVLGELEPSSRSPAVRDNMAHPAGITSQDKSGTGTSGPMPAGMEVSPDLAPSPLHTPRRREEGGLSSLLVSDPEWQRTARIEIKSPRPDGISQKKNQIDSQKNKVLFLL